MASAGTLGVTASLKAHIVFGIEKFTLAGTLPVCLLWSFMEENYDENFDYLITCSVIPRFVI